MYPWNVEKRVKECGIRNCVHQLVYQAATLLVHESAAGAILGKGGNNIKHTKEATGAHVLTWTNSHSDDEAEP